MLFIPKWQNKKFKKIFADDESLEELKKIEKPPENVYLVKMGGTTKFS